MASQLSKPLEQALLPNNGDWGLAAVELDSTNEEVKIDLEYLKETVEVAGREYAIYDYRRERSWRHLDLWQHKTWIISRVPRYKDGREVKTLAVPWAEAHERLSWMLEKKL